MTSGDMLLIMIKWVGIYLLVGINVVLIYNETVIKEMADGVSETTPFDYKIIYGVLISMVMIFWLPFVIWDIGMDIKFAIENLLGYGDDEEDDDEDLDEDEEDGEGLEDTGDSELDKHK
ncbi:hypothetical protein ACTFR8_23700 [Bacillus cereus group sp. MYBK15-3]|uniref:hypothetical protein n=1 Tax=unclassified Bacillus cereus group TaxID=2750818 RepID=UPI003F78F6E3